MKKSIYSLVLSDDVVSAIDRLASENGISRSSLINQILAERFSLATPEMQNRDIFSAMEKLMDETFQILNQPSDSMFAVRSHLRYKYRPTIRYQLDLSHETRGDAIGILKISLRTQNQQLIELLSSFFSLWEKLESHYITSTLGHAIRYHEEEGKLFRELYHPANLPVCSGEDVGNAIADYIQMMDECIKTYFAHLEEPENHLASLVEKDYRTWLSRSGFVVI